MQKLEKILEEIKGVFEQNIVKELNGDGTVDKYSLDPWHIWHDIEEVIRKHMNVDWIPVEEEWPPFGKKLQATILHHEWISDYDSSWVPEEEKVHHASYTEVCEIHPMGVMWCYACAEDDYHNDIAYIEPAKDLNRPVAEIIAWRPLPEPYRPKKDN